MSKHDLSREELLEKLDEQMKMLRARMEAFDAGRHYEALSMAVIIRGLVHDTGRSKSLLTQLGAKDRGFVDTAYQLDEHRPYMGLTTVVLFGDALGPIIANFDDRGAQTLKPFHDWWCQPVFDDGRGIRLTRRDIILQIAHKDGGAHIDGDMDTAYRSLKQTGLGWAVFRTNEELEYILHHERFAARQIAHEIFKTLDSSYARRNSFQYLGVSSVQLVYDTGQEQDITAGLG
jgi:hypothetical protein